MKPATQRHALSRALAVATAAVLGTLSVSPANAAETHEIIASGSVCQPTTPADAASLDYSDGRAMALAPVTVTCPLPPVPPGYVQVSAQVNLNDSSGHWKNLCRFHNASLASESYDTWVRPAEVSPRIGIALFPTEKVGYPAHTVICDLHTGQSVYAAVDTVKSL